MSSPRVSVVLAVRNGADTILESCRSVLEQEDVDLELLVVDDGSSDMTPKLLREIAAADPRVRILEGPGRGLTEALIQGCAEARSALIARQDAGDRSLPGRLRHQLAALDAHPRVNLVSGWTLCEAPRGEELYWRKSSKAGEPVSITRPGPADPAGVGPTAHGSTVFRAEDYRRVGGYRSEFRLAQDWDLWLRLAEVGLYYEVPDGVYVQRLESGSLSFQHQELQRAFGDLALQAAVERADSKTDAHALETARRLAENWPTSSGRPAERRATARADYHFGATLAARRDPRARRYLREAVRREPTLWKAWVRLAQSLLQGGKA